MNDLLKVEFTGSDSVQTIELKLSSSSCWSTLLGNWPMPVEGSIDQLVDAIRDEHVTHVRIIGCPSASLLPTLWLRSSGYIENSCTIELVWDVVSELAQHQSNGRGQQHAAQLAANLASSVTVSDPAAALRLWGIDADTESDWDDSFDLLTGLVDLWDTSLATAFLSSDWSDSVRRVLSDCGVMGYERIAIYGAGTHTRAVGDALREPGVQISCIIDDDPRSHERCLWGYPVVSREQAVEMDLDAIVLSANSIEDLLWERSSVFRDKGVPVLRLYGVSEPETDRVSTVLV